MTFPNVREFGVEYAIRLDPATRAGSTICADLRHSESQ
jgi:hypothetical protein